MSMSELAVQELMDEVAIITLKEVDAAIRQWLDSGATNRERPGLHRTRRILQRIVAKMSRPNPPVSPEGGNDSA